MNRVLPGLPPRENRFLAWFFPLLIPVAAIVGLFTMGVTCDRIFNPESTAQATPLVAIAQDLLYFPLAALAATTLLAAIFYLRQRFEKFIDKVHWLIGFALLFGLATLLVYALSTFLLRSFVSQ